MCCCNRPNRCCCRCGCCSNNGNGGAVTLPSFPDLSRLSGGGDSSRWPVYVSVPAFLWDLDDDESGSCGCCRG